MLDDGESLSHLNVSLRSLRKELQIACDIFDAEPKYQTTRNICSVVLLSEIAAWFKAYERLPKPVKDYHGLVWIPCMLAAIGHASTAVAAYNKVLANLHPIINKTLENDAILLQTQTGEK